MGSKRLMTSVTLSRLASNCAQTHGQRWVV